MPMPTRIARRKVEAGAKAPAAPKARAKRPKGELAAQLSELAPLRPAHVPETAFLHAAWVNLPGANAQEREDFMKAQRWKTPIFDHFAACAELYPHPGPLLSPRVHILIISTSPGDEKNRGKRAKYVIDRLEPLKEVQFRRTPTKTNPSPTGVRRHGLLGLIENDRILTDQTCTIDERRAKVTATENDAKVLMWVWDDLSAAVF